jgi:hypothetical protein
MLSKELERSPDITGRWMAHYVAEQMQRAANSTGDERVTAEKECRDSILDLWAHRTDLPTRSRPLSRFEAILDALTSLAPNGEGRYFWSPESPKARGAIGEYLQAADAIDAAARSLIRLCIGQASSVAAADEAKWLEAALRFAQDQTVHIVRVLVDDAEALIGSHPDKADQREEIMRNIDLLIGMGGKLRMLLLRD